MLPLVNLDDPLLGKLLKRKLNHFNSNQPDIAYADKAVFVSGRNMLLLHGIDGKEFVSRAENWQLT